MDKSQDVPIDQQTLAAFYSALGEESDRARAMIVAAWIDHLLEMKLRQAFSGGNSEARKKLFSMGGSFSSFSARTNVAFCAGWIDQDLFHDIEVLRGIRNEFAHSFEHLSMDSPQIHAKLEKLLVPRRHIYDWGRVKAAALENGVVIYTGEKPEAAGEDLRIPGRLTFHLAAPLILGVLLANLGLHLRTDSGTLLRIDIPEHMKCSTKGDPADREQTRASRPSAPSG